MSDTKNIIEDTNKLVGQLKGNLEKLMQQQHQALNNLPKDQRDHVAKHQAYLNKIMKTVKTGDIDKIQQIVDNHANTNN